MGCGSSKGVANQVQGSGKRSTGTKDPLPATLATSPFGRFPSALPPVAEGRRDFARIFFATETRIFILAKGLPSMRPIQPSTGPSSAHIGDMSEQVVERATALFGESLSLQLSQASMAQLEPAKLERLVERAISSMTVNVGLDFAVQMQLMPMFLQPAFLIILLGEPLQAKAATYGFVASRPQQIQGDRPESKRTPFCVRLLSPDLLAADTEECCQKWEVSYSAMEVSTSTITEAMRKDAEKVHEAINLQRWDPLEK